MNRPKFLIVHHTGGTDADPLADTSNHTFEIVDDYHRQLWQFKSSLGHYIGYHYFINKKGVVTQGRADTDEGAHTRGYNTTSIGICLAGNFDRTKPTAAQTKALTSLLLQLMNKHGITADNIVPHRKFANKTCYGRNLSDDWARSLVAVQPNPLKSYTTMELVQELQRRIAEGEL
jgi:N-acetyl-anhydromuramyl-L-alanine amidase AmpD